MQSVANFLLYMWPQLFKQKINANGYSIREVRVDTSEVGFISVREPSLGIDWQKQEFTFLGNKGTSSSVVMKYGVTSRGESSNQWLLFLDEALLTHHARD
ncbi:hypothetical protein NPIL_17761 [Nephila pilipes]|uniref:Uncharacterized protein n=1 Tax=Nephila pilipes TaxID=299642 RepID=A0A8X6R3A2_NEPPI|nr:hypothetical protein NPIL_17761 [Nephila pilipes]